MTDKYDFYCEEALSGKTKVNKLYESDNVLAFYHTKPFYAIHIVIIPKKHILDLSSLNDDELLILNEIMLVARNLSQTLDKEQWIRLVTNIGAFQDTPHMHFHLIAGKKLRGDI